MKTHGELRWEDGAWHLKAAPYVMIRAKRLFPRANQYRTGFLVMSDTPESSRDLEWLTGRYPVVVDDAAAARLAGRADEHRETENVVMRILNGDLPDVSGFELARPAREYQKVAAAIAIQRPARRLTISTRDSLERNRSTASCFRFGLSVPVVSTVSRTAATSASSVNSTGAPASTFNARGRCPRR